MKDQQELERTYSNLLKDIEFNKLALLSNKPNIFFALGIGEHEIRHSNFLAWLLNPKESHGLNDLFLTRFLRDIILDERANNISIFELPNLNFNNTTIYREWSNIDLLIKIDDLVIAIENKFNSTEHNDHLSRYRETIETSFPTETKLFVYLTPFGDEASESKTYINYSYEQIVSILVEVVTLYEHSLSSVIITYLSDYIHAIKISRYGK